MKDIPMKNQSAATKTVFALTLSLLLLSGGATATAWAQDAGAEASPPESAATESAATEAEGRMSMNGMMKNCPMIQGGMMNGGQMQGGPMQGDMQGGMMGMMMRRMASDPVRRSVMQVYTLPALQDALSLGEDQVASLKETKQQFTEQRAQIQEDLTAKKKQLRETLRADRPNLEQVETLLTERAALEVDAQMASVEAATQMTGVLSTVQREKLAGLKPMQMHRAMMKSISMADMMHLMSVMEMSCPMMNGDMMNGSNGTMRMEGENQHGGKS